MIEMDMKVVIQTSFGLIMNKGEMPHVRRHKLVQKVVVVDDSSPHQPPGSGG